MNWLIKKLKCQRGEVGTDIEQQPQGSEDELFSTFFAEAAGGELEAPAATPDEGTPDPAEAERLAAEQQADSEKAEADRLAAEQAAAAEKDKGATPSVDEIIAQAQAAALKAVEDKTAAEKAEADRLASEQAAKPTPEEEEADRKFREDWPDHAAKLDEQAKRLTALEQMVKDQMAQLQAKVDPVLAATQEDADAKFKNAVLDAHSDAFDIIPEVDAWVKTQPEYLQEAYNKVLDSGTAKQVIDVLNTFKLSTGKTTPSAEDTAAAEAKAAEERKAQEARDKVKHLTPVGSRRVASQGGIDKSDFDGAFAEAARAITQKAV